MLFSDTHIDDAVGVLLSELVKACRAQHGRRDAHNAAIFIGQCHDFIGKDRGPRGATGRLNRLARLRVDLTHGVELVGNIGERRAHSLCPFA